LNKAWIGLLLAFAVGAPAAGLKVYRVDDHIFRGRQPRRDEFPQLKALGIRTVLDLRGGPVHKPHERGIVKANGMEYISIRLSGIFEPHDDQITQILNVLQNPARWPIFIHCRRGDDRLGMVIACYRIAHDHWTNQQAYQEASHDGMSRFEILMRRYIRSYQPPDNASAASGESH
jgi:tyrosine-protein phosphatase SIW14